MGLISRFDLLSQAFGDGAQGFVNAILFCLMTDKVKLFFKRCLGRKEGERERLLARNNADAVNPASHHSSPV